MLLHHKVSAVKQEKNSLIGYTKKYIQTTIVFIEFDLQISNDSVLLHCCGLNNQKSKYIKTQPTT